MIKAILLRNRGIDIPVKGSKISMSVGFEGTGKFILGRTECRPNAYFACKKGAKLRLGDNVFVNRNTIMVCHKEISVGDGTAIGPNVCIFDHDHRYGPDGFKTKEFKDGTVRIGKNVWIGAGAVILRDTDIGDNCIIGAGTVVKGTVPANTMIVSDSENRTINLDA